MARKTRILMQLCPMCGHKITAASDFQTNQSPVPGDKCVCLKCAAVLVFGEGLQLRFPTVVEIAALETDPEISRARSIIMEGAMLFGKRWCAD